MAIYFISHNNGCNEYNGNTRIVLDNQGAYVTILVGLNWEGNNASYGRITHTRRRGTHSQNERGYCQTKTQDGRNQGLQAGSWLKKSLEDQARRIETLYRRDGISAKLKAAFSRRLLTKLEVVHTMSKVFQTVDTVLDSRYLYAYYNWTPSKITSLVQCLVDRYGWRLEGIS